MNIPPGSILSSPCAHITIQSTGESAYALDGFYERYIFGTYRFVSIDARGNNMYHADSQGRDLFITKNMDSHWVVNITILRKLKAMM